MRIDISSIKEDKPVEVVLLIENRFINLVLFYKTNKTITKSYIEVKQLYHQQSHDKYIDKSIIKVECQKTGFGYRRFFKCPHCGKRRKYLYPIGIGLFACRGCIERNVYAYRTNIYDENIENIIKYKITMNLIKINFDFNELVGMTDLLSHIPDKPKNMRWNKYEIICKRIYFLHFIYWRIVNEAIESIKVKELNEMLDQRNVDFAYENIICPIYFNNLNEYKHKIVHFISSN